MEPSPRPSTAQGGAGRPPTIREVARQAGVSPMTVSRVLTGRGYVTEGTANRVRAVFERLEYRPNPVARLLRRLEQAGELQRDVLPMELLLPNRPA